MQDHFWRVEEFDEIDSTNTWLAEQARRGAREGLVARADYQSAGRGRLERTWESAAGSALLCSLLLRPGLASEDLAYAVAAVALSARGALATLSGLVPSLKWPNDLVVHDQKLGGLLAEVVAVGDELAVVVGLGINLTDHASANPHATNLWRESAQSFGARAVLDAVLIELDTRRDLLASSEGRTAVLAEWRAALSTLGRRVRVIQHDAELEGVALDLDLHGGLVVDVAGERRVFTVGDVVHLRVAEGS
ncbi:MAG TPA: biotin--[acetyl-CoA-carboxylase] ligase [Acidimicrobiales bacterium]|nr:biotin--[acetyl-CoA-carboxylase] ligase [Acidimicrobiales bacterium]